MALRNHQQKSYDEILAHGPNKYIIYSNRRAGKTYFFAELNEAFIILRYLVFHYSINPQNLHTGRAQGNLFSIAQDLKGIGPKPFALLLDDIECIPASLRLDTIPTPSYLIMTQSLNTNVSNIHLRNTGAISLTWPVASGYTHPLGLANPTPMPPPTSKIFSIPFKYGLDPDEIVAAQPMTGVETPLKDRNKGRDTCIHCQKPLLKMGRTVICTHCEKD